MKQRNDMISTDTVADLGANAIGTLAGTCTAPNGTPGSTARPAGVAV